MDTSLSRFDKACFLTGRSLLGLYFLVPGVMKIAQYSSTLSLMSSKGVPFASALLPLTIVIQVGLGVFLIVGKQLRLSALILFGLTVLINLYIHNFWDLSGQADFGHELQNFIKNVGIAAGLLVLASKERN